MPLCVIIRIRVCSHTYSHTILPIRIIRLAISPVRVSSWVSSINPIPVTFFIRVGQSNPIIYFAGKVLRFNEAVLLDGLNFHQLSTESNFTECVCSVPGDLFSKKCVMKPFMYRPLSLQNKLEIDKYSQWNRSFFNNANICKLQK